MNNYYKTQSILILTIITLINTNPINANVNYELINDDYKCTSGDCYNGKGKIIYSDNTIYEGEFNNGLADGYGICNYADGSTYVGYWKNNTIEGEGIYYQNNGVIIKGIWKANRLIEKNDDILGNRTLRFEDEYIEEVDASMPESKTWVVIVGVSRYPNKQSLNFTDDDAYRFHSFIKSPEGGAVRDEQIALLIDETATKKNIIKSLEKISAQADEDDTFLFYFSGHGISGGFLPHDYLDASTIVEHDEVMDILSSSKAKSKIVIADACHSGSMIAHRGVTEEAVIQNYYDAIQKSKGGLILLMSSKSEETSLENKGLRQGVFSFYLMEGLKGEADKDNDQVICAKELFEYVKKNVSSYTNYFQTPVIYGQNDNKIPMGVIRN